MRILRRGAALSLFLLFTLVAPLRAQQDPFRWMDFHNPKDQDIVFWVTRALEAEKWTAIREIGVEWDAALVITTLRRSPQSPADADTFAIYSVNLTNKLITPLLTGSNLRHLDFLRLSEGRQGEPAILYDNCANCAADTYLTSFYYDIARHNWSARWLRGTQAIPVWTAAPPPGVEWTQVFAVMAEPNGVQYIGTWNHMEFGPEKPPEDYLYRYDRDPFNSIERTALVSSKEAEAFKIRLCKGQDALPGLTHGQDSALCHALVHPAPERRPVTSPPANNHGQSSPPGVRR